MITLLQLQLNLQVKDFENWSAFGKITRAKLQLHLFSFDDPI